MKHNLKLMEVRLSLSWMPVYNVAKIQGFFDFLNQHTEIQTVSLGAGDCELDEIVAKIKSILQHVSVNMFCSDDWEEYENAAFKVPDKLRLMESLSLKDEIQMLQTLNQFPVLRKLTYSLETYEDSEEVIQEMLNMKLDYVSLKKLTLFGIDYLDENTPSLSVFKNLETLCLGGRFANSRFAQLLYYNNFRTLRRLEFRIDESENIFNLFPSEDLNLTLNALVFYLNSNNSFVKQLVKQQVPNLKSLTISNTILRTDNKIEFDEELMDSICKAERLEYLSLNCCRINVGTFSPSFSNLKTLRIEWRSEVSHFALWSLLGQSQVQSTLESLSLKEIRLTGDPQRNLTCNYNFRKRKAEQRRMIPTCPFNFRRLKSLDLRDVNIQDDYLNYFCAPELEQLHYDYSGLEIPWNYILKYPKLKVLCLEQYDIRYNSVSRILSSFKNLEVMKLKVSSDSLIKVVNCVMNHGKHMKLVIIKCPNLPYFMRLLKRKCEELIRKNAGFELLSPRGEGIIKMSSISTTIFVYDSDYNRSDYCNFYKDVMFEICESK